MKNYLFIFILLYLTVVPLFAQNPALTANDWVLTELSVNGTTTLPSNIVNLNAQDVVLQFTDTGMDYTFNTYVCLNEAIAGTISYPLTSSTIEQFNFLSSAQTLGMCCDPQPDITMPPDPDCVAILEFSDDYFDFWNAPANEVYDYEIASIANATILRVTKINGDFALYGNAVASNDSIDPNLDVFLNNNPIDEKLIIMGISSNEISKVFIYDTNGRVILKNTSYQEHIDVSHLTTGIYILKVEVDGFYQTLKFIK